MFRTFVSLFRGANVLTYPCFCWCHNWEGETFLCVTKKQSKSVFCPNENFGRLTLIKCPVCGRSDSNLSVNRIIYFCDTLLLSETGTLFGVYFIRSGNMTRQKVQMLKKVVVLSYI